LALRHGPQLQHERQPGPQLSRQAGQIQLRASTGGQHHVSLAASTARCAENSPAQRGCVYPRHGAVRARAALRWRGKLRDPGALPAEGSLSLQRPFVALAHPPSAISLAASSPLRLRRQLAQKRLLQPDAVHATWSSRHF
jgi:hypothetical protein